MKRMAPGVWLVPYLAPVAILGLSLFLRWLWAGIIFPTWPERVIQVVYLMSTIVIPWAAIVYARADASWRALGRAWRDLTVVLVSGAAITILALWFPSHSLPINRAAHPMRYAEWPFLVVWIELAVVVEASVFVGWIVPGTGRFREPWVLALAIMAGEWVCARFVPGVSSMFTEPLMRIYTNPGIPPNGLTFPWATVQHIILGSVVVGALLLGLLATMRYVRPRI